MENYITESKTGKKVVVLRCYLPTDPLFVYFSLCSACITRPSRNKAFVRPTKHPGVTIRHEVTAGVFEELDCWDMKGRQVCLCLCVCFAVCEQYGTANRLLQIEPETLISSVLKYTWVGRSACFSPYCVCERVFFGRTETWDSERHAGLLSPFLHHPTYRRSYSCVCARQCPFFFFLS